MSSKTKHQTPDAIRLKHVRARRKFKAAVHLVMANLYWLQDMGEDEELGENVMKNIAMLLKKKKSKKSLLTFKDKVILCKNPDERTEEEKFLLFKKIGDLKCFRKYRTNVKMKLAAACHFCYYPPNRVVVRQNGQGQSLYFIMSGEVAVSITELDPVLNEYKTKVVGTMETGQMFGEVSLLHNIPRTATITTLTHCEMIVLEKEDFNKVLKTTLQAVWDEILAAMSRFRYFDGWDEVSMRECCIYSRIVQYRKNEVVFGSGASSDNYVHFILNGQCRMIEELPVVRTNIHGIRTYELFDREAYKKKRQSARKSIKRTDSNPSLAPSKRQSRVTIRQQAEIIGRKEPNLIRRPSSLFKGSKTSLTRASTSSIKQEKKLGVFKLGEELSEEDEESEDGKLSQKAQVDALKKLLGIYVEAEEEIPLPVYVDVIFMQICLFNKLASFGFGEYMRYRKIVAVTDYVDCLLIPKFWIWQKNRANVWTQVVYTLNKLIPTTEAVFDIFLENRSWGKWKRELVNKVAMKPACNVMNNVPYSVRLMEDINYGVDYRS